MKICLQISDGKTRRIQVLKLVGVKEFYNITRAKVVSALNCAIVMTICATATFAVDTALNTNTVQAKPMETFAQTQETNIVVVFMPEEPDQTTESEEVTTTTTTTTTSATSSETTEATSESTTEETDATTEATTTTTAAETTTEATTAETTEGITEKELYLVVYATTAINVRSGPGTEYDIVKGLYAGDQIDVCAVTSNGWYKTYNGNYVLASLTTETKPTSTPVPTPKPTSSSSSSTSSTATKAPQPAPAGEGNSCTITFYGPQPNGDGTYSCSTATGTTCVEGRTCAADWSIYPAGTVIYIENDPLGGDGYYTVEDRGPGVKGYHIDIYADDGESGNHSTCTRTVYAQ